MAWLVKSKNEQKFLDRIITVEGRVVNDITIIFQKTEEEILKLASEAGIQIEKIEEKVKTKGGK